MHPDIAHYGKICDGWLLDTDILSQTMGRRTVHPGVEELVAKIADERFCISAITIVEIQKGIDLVGPAESKRQRLLREKLEMLADRWSERILAIDERVCRKWGEFQAHYRSRAKPVPAVDALIAATAHVHNLVLVSHDGMFERMRDRIAFYDPLVEGPLQSS